MNSSQLLMKRSEVDFFHADADHGLVVLAQLADERRKIRVAADDGKSVDVAFRVTKIERVDDHPDVGGILARLPDVRDLDQLEGRFMQAALEGFVTLEIAIRLLHHDVALEQQALDHFANLEGRELRVVRADGDILQIEKDSHRGLGVGCAHRSEDVSEIAVAKQEKIHRVKRTRPCHEAIDHSPAALDGGRLVLNGSLPRTEAGN